ncbi:MAG TPA: hypothetical protein VFC93_15035 [Chloroflexota bacterium]|nr:hypothetical protein [Chloroflexota bacterium]
MIAALRARRVHLDRPQTILLVLCLFFALVDALVLLNLLAAERERDGIAAQAVALERAIGRIQERGGAALIGSQLRPGENPFPTELPTADLANLVVQSAQQSGVQIGSMMPQLGGQEKLAQGTYRTYKLQIRATGTAQQLQDFLTRIQQGSVRTWVIDNTQLRPTGGGQWEMAFDLTVYAQAAA